MVGTVIVIWASLRRLDRDRFVILQQVNDEHESNGPSTVKYGLSFPPSHLCLFIHLAFAYHMIKHSQNKLASIVVRIFVALSTSTVFLITYLIVFWITSRSYRKVCRYKKEEARSWRGFLCKTDYVFVFEGIYKKTETVEVPVFDRFLLKWCKERSPGWHLPIRNNQIQSF